MKESDRDYDWTDANQRLLVAEFTRLKARLAGDETKSAADVVEPIQLALPTPAAIDRLTDCFGLSAFERDLLLLCAGVEMDSNLAAMCSATQNTSQYPCATFGLALTVLDKPHWSALSPFGPLRRWRLIEVVGEHGLTNAQLRIDERVLHFLAGINHLDNRLAPLLQSGMMPATMAVSHQQTVHDILQALIGRQGPLPMLQLVGNDGDGQADIAAVVAGEFGLQLHILRAQDIPAGTSERDAFALLWHRESALLPGALLIECRDREGADGVTWLAARLNGLVFVAGGYFPLQQPGALRFTVDKPAPPEQRLLWQQALGPASSRLNGSLDGVASQYRFSAQMIVVAGSEISNAVAACDNPDEVLWRACRSLGRRQLDDLAQRVQPASSWEDLILPEHQKDILRQIVAHVRNRLKVCEDWGFAGKSSRGLGLSTLFVGESGTGKTMAAEVIAKELRLDLYRIDLSAVVSKYIGETEKNLSKVFNAAEDSGVILLFDEADALFGKRSEVKDSHDRYANIEVGYLLQRMETYSGLAVLTTNMRTSLDTAFQRRLRFIVQFSFPDREQREAIWRSIFPKAAPTADLDYYKLAQLQMAGGSIRNIAFTAAFLAADAGESIGMAHLRRAAYSESAKRERPLSEAETRGWI